MWIKMGYCGTLALAVGALCCMTALGEDADPRQFKSSVDRDYRKTYQYYNRLYAEDKRQIRDFYMNQIMASAAARGGAIPAGAIVVLEVYGAKVGSDGKLLRDINGKMIAGPLNVISVMETIDGANGYFPSDVSNGDWVYFFYSDDFEDKTASQDRTDCLRCHKKVESSQFIFTRDAMLKAVK